MGLASHSSCVPRAICSKYPSMWTVWAIFFAAGLTMMGVLAGRTGPQPGWLVVASRPLVDGSGSLCIWLLSPWDPRTGAKPLMSR